MSNILAALLALSSSYLPLNPVGSLEQEFNNLANMSIIIPIYRPSADTVLSADALAELLHNEAPTLRVPVINKVVTSLKCANQMNVDHNHILTVVDYSLPSSEKRLWVFDLKGKKLLFHTYVSHGIKSGTLLTNYFSNKYNSKASSIGVYKTEKAYYGREGLSLRLDGLDRSFNDNASNRSVVMHGGWYVDEDFIKKYGRPGRSWGCPALPLSEYRPIINTIKDNSWMVVYYPAENWFVKSRFLNCRIPDLHEFAIQDSAQIMPIAPDNEPREAVLLADLRKGYRSENGKAIVAMRADNYEKIFNTKPPLGRMLRRQIANSEYIALSKEEFDRISANLSTNPQARDLLSMVHFVIPVIIMVRGYYETQMQIVNLGAIKNIKPNAETNNTSYTVYFDKQSALNLKPTDQFIRWLGL